ncbi:hypothetical protein F6X86_02525 [Enterococcus durans]|uniref:Uncharacterized protein n=1 Tax=Enterococcus durans TaxID=53345 RepID=A0A5N0YSG5_9ENTE|nr:hypothetical protein [Enterococcus durans]KAA9180525.1 hypothetical protein F6X86_02525 [Enterococcus durans]KAA9185297.1 hypothetical protein F6X85_08460 [Enterococcus durans]KAA9186108.1 hypothetical protein F6X90_07855 [Enterococcus durans]KAA9190646.1 hypothetical protein F6Y12_07440 [Enterococcus durans]KAA9192722.1 hypothetical protein F6X88_08540 [Enterococcus durans]
MNNNGLSIKDIFSFFKSHLKIYLATLLLSIILVGGLFFYSSISQNKIKQIEEINVPLFSFILENEQGNIMNTSGAVKEVFLTSLEDSNQFKQEVVEKLTVSYDDISNTINVRFVDTVSKSDEDQVKRFLRQELDEKKLSFFKNKTFYYVNNDINQANQNKLPITETVSKKKIILLVLVIFILTVIISTVLISWLEHKNKKVSQKFFLGDDVQTIDINSLDLSSKADQKRIIYSILNGTNTNKLVVSEDKQFINQLTTDNLDRVSGYYQLQDIENPVGEKTEELIIICVKQKTTKKWYKEQLEIGKALTNNIKTIYI